MPSDPNPYQSPQDVDAAAERPSGLRPEHDESGRQQPVSYVLNIHFEPIAWGKLTPFWTVAFLFGAVWFFGSVSTFILLATLPESVRRFFSFWNDYDVAGYLSFLPCGALALLLGLFILVHDRAQWRQPWPALRTIGPPFLASTLVMLPVWIIYIISGGGFSFVFPRDGEWVAIALGAFLGLVHGGLCYRGLRLRRPVSSASSAMLADDPSPAASTTGWSLELGVFVEPLRRLAIIGTVALLTSVALFIAFCFLWPEFEPLKMYQVMGLGTAWDDIFWLIVMPMGYAAPALLVPGLIMTLPKVPRRPFRVAVAFAVVGMVIPVGLAWSYLSNVPPRHYQQALGPIVFGVGSVFAQLVVGLAAGWRWLQPRDTQALEQVE